MKKINTSQQIQNVENTNTLLPMAKTLIAGISLFLATSCCCDKTPQTPEGTWKAYEKAKNERCDTQEDIAKTKEKIYKFQMKLQELEMKENFASQKEQSLFNQAKQTSESYSSPDCPTCN